MAMTGAEKQAAYRDRKNNPIPDSAFERLHATLDRVLAKVAEIQDILSRLEVKDIATDKCMDCGKDLPPAETPRLVKELCHDCVWGKQTSEAKNEAIGPESSDKER